jgi:hypothetical protein
MDGVADADNRLIIQAATNAQRAVDSILEISVQDPHESKEADRPEGVQCERLAA